MVLFPLPLLYHLGSENEAEEKQDSEKPLLELWVRLVKVSLWKWNCTSEVVEYGAFLQVDSKLNSENMRVIIVIFLLIMWICQAHFII